jgi:Bor protein
MGPVTSRLRLAAALLALSLAGCQTIRYQTGRPAAPTYVTQEVHFFLWGLVGKPVIDLDAACPQGVAAWRSDAKAGDWFLDVITLGIYNPRTVTIQCVEVKR